MNDSLQNQRLNDLVIRVYRSLLQYTNECWPWGGAEEEFEQKTVAELAANQLHHLEPLADLVLDRSGTIDYGIYPMDFGELHYVALEYLMHELLQNEAGLIATLEREQIAAAADAELAAILGDLLAAEKQHVAKLKELATKAPAALS